MYALRGTAHSLAIAALFLLPPESGSAKDIDRDNAAEAFIEFEEMCTADGGKLWGISLCGKMMIVDPETRIAFFNAPPPIEHRRIDTALFTARYPANSTVANTSIKWEGETWIQLMYLPDSDAGLRALLAHEAYHGIQDKLGYVGQDAFNSHLEEERARIWLRLEAKALAAALGAKEDEAMRQALADAAHFNRARAIHYPLSRSNEASLVNHEGLAEYTGVTIGGGEESVALALDRLNTVNTRPSLVRSVGYVVGPAYGLLLDRLGADWKAAALMGAPLPLLIEDALAEPVYPVESADRYGIDTIVADEAGRAAERKQRLASLRGKFVEGPVLILPFEKMNISFDPNRIVGLDDIGSVRGGAEIVDVWGKLVVEGDLLIDAEWSGARVSLFGTEVTELADGELRGDDWVLELADGWLVLPGEREGDWTIGRESASPAD